MAKDLRAYVARVTCPVLVMRSPEGSELTHEKAPELAGLWVNGRAVDVEGSFALHNQNPAGVAEAITAFVDSAVSLEVPSGR